MNKIKILYKQYGLGVFNRLIKSALIRFGLIHETLLVFEKQLNYEDLDKRLKKIDVSNVKKITLKDFDTFSGLTQSRKELYKKRLDEGSYLVFGIFNNNKLVYYSWVSLKNIGLPFGFQNKIKLDGNQALLEDSFCDADFRGQGYHSKVNIVRQRAILDSGRTEAKVLVVKDNIPAIKTQLKSDFILTSKIVLKKIFKKEYIRTQKIKTNAKN
ncbi:MAG: hypothetical protein VYD59_01270 [Bacteroidota bacterium]|nr:hypothetical protein [Bacteroidota bacterium]